MTALPDRPNTALLIVDVQRDVVAGAHDRDAVIANISALLERARSSDTAVIWVQHEDEGLPRGSDGWQYVEELQRDGSEPLVHKHFGDSFEDTDLETILGPGRSGTSSSPGLRPTPASGARCTAPSSAGTTPPWSADAHTTEDPSQYGLPLNAEQVIAHTNMYWGYSAAPGRSGATVATADVDFTSRSA